jgi:hypothetical protein
MRNETEDMLGKRKGRKDVKAHPVVLLCCSLVDNKINTGGDRLII